jgi:hypothetical protein
MLTSSIVDLDGPLVGHIHRILSISNLTIIHRGLGSADCYKLVMVFLGSGDECPRRLRTFLTTSSPENQSIRFALTDMLDDIYFGFRQPNTFIYSELVDVGLPIFLKPIGRHSIAHTLYTTLHIQC